MRIGSGNSPAEGKVTGAQGANVVYRTGSFLAYGEDALYATNLAQTG